MVNEFFVGGFPLHRCAKQFVHIKL